MDDDLSIKMVAVDDFSINKSIISRHFSKKFLSEGILVEKVTVDDFCGHC